MKTNNNLLELGVGIGLAFLGVKVLKELFTPKKQKTSLFISHSWKHDKPYNLLLEKFDKNGFDFTNNSISKDNPFLVEDRQELLCCLEQEIKKSSKVVVMGGMYVAHSSTIQDEICLAKKNNKEIVAIKPRGAKRVPRIIQENADYIVGTYTPSILNKIQS